MQSTQSQNKGANVWFVAKDRLDDKDSDASIEVEDHDDDKLLRVRRFFVGYVPFHEKHSKKGIRS